VAGSSSGTSGQGQGNSAGLNQGGKAGQGDAGQNDAGQAGQGDAGAAPGGQAGSSAQAGTPQGGSGQDGGSGGFAGSSSGSAGGGQAGQAGSAGSAHGGSAGQGGSAGKAGSQTADCPIGLPGPPLVRVSSPDNVAYCIDRFEVSQEQYAAFVAAKGSDFGDQPEVCAWNKEYTPKEQSDSSSTGCPVGVYDPAKKGALPMACADWCDAKAYCAWAGKRLCGKIGGGSAAPESYADAKASQWFNACSQGGKTVYPYGDTYKAGLCVDGANQGEQKQPQEATMAGDCHGQQPPFSEIAHLSGNVWEWEDRCEEGGPGGGLFCGMRGGGFSLFNLEKDTRCDGNSTTGIAIQNAAVGIRCCLDF